jgi:hypothetical protein
MVPDSPVLPVGGIGMGRSLNRTAQLKLNDAVRIWLAWVGSF